jgi:hypothetical protein
MVRKIYPIIGWTWRQAIHSSPFAIDRIEIYRREAAATRPEVRRDLQINRHELIFQDKPVVEDLESRVNVEFVRGFGRRCVSTMDERDTNGLIAMRYVARSMKRAKKSFMIVNPQAAARDQ